MVRKRSTLIGAASLTVLTAGVFALAWNFWPPLLHYRDNRALNRARSVVRDYLAGKESRTLATHHLASALSEWEGLWASPVHSAVPPSGGSLQAEAISLAPDGVSEDDPRIVDLYIEAMKAMIPADASPTFRSQVEAMWDSART